MKKYKFIKRYPNYPTSMVTGNIVEWNESMELYHHSLTLDTFKKSEIEGYPEFWEEIIEKEYEILSFKDIRKDCPNDGQRIWKKEENGRFHLGGYSTHVRGISEEVMLSKGTCVNSGDFEIHSVKRLSDGEVFTVEDSISAEHKQWNNVHIVKFEENDRDIWVKNSSGGCHAISDIIINTNPQPLFTTEDGVAIYDGDTYYWVGDDNYKDNSICKKWEVSAPCKIENNHVSFVAGVHSFSTKEAAEEYLLMNKKLISGNDLLEYLREVGTRMDKLGDGFVEFLKRKAEL